MEKCGVYCFVLSTILLFSCQIKGNFKGLYSYKNEMIGFQPLVESDQFSCDLKYSQSSKVARAGGSQLKGCLDIDGKTLIYIWQPNCSSEKCIDLNLLQSICTDKGTSLYIVAQYYDKNKMAVDYNIINPIIGIDTDYYHTERTSKYLNKFLVDLGGPEMPKVESGFFMFENGAFCAQSNEINLLIGC